MYYICIKTNTMEAKEATEEHVLSIKDTLGVIINEYNKAKTGAIKWAIDGVQSTRSGWLEHHGLSIASYNALKTFYKSDSEIEGCPISLKKINTVLTNLGFSVNGVVFFFKR